MQNKWQAITCTNGDKIRHHYIYELIKPKTKACAYLMVYIVHGRCSCYFICVTSGDVLRFKFIYEHLLWNCFQVNAKEYRWWWVNIGSGNGLVPSWRHRAIISADVDPDLCRHMTSQWDFEFTILLSNIALRTLFCLIALPTSFCLTLQWPRYSLGDVWSLVW